jgi:hypothetical protein
MVIAIEGLEDMALYFKDIPLWYSKTEACIHLLEVVAKRCTCLTLGHTANSIHVEKPYVVELKNEATKWRSRHSLKGPFKALRKHLSLGISRSRSSHASGTYPRRSYPLKTLIFQSNTFLLPPFSGWAFEIMNAAPLTRLDLIGVELLSYASALIFGALTIPTLEHLRIIGCPFEFDHLADFLSRHSTISTFSIITWDVHQPLQLPITTLPALVSLESTQTTSTVSSHLPVHFRN